MDWIGLGQQKKDPCATLGWRQLQRLTAGTVVSAANGEGDENG